MTMINKESIEKAATSNAYLQQDFFHPQAFDALEQGFIDGAYWFKESIWHNSNDYMPYHNAVCLCYDNLYEQYRVLIYNDIYKCWNDTIIDVREPIGEYRITRWCYIDDLIGKI